MGDSDEDQQTNNERRRQNHSHASEDNDHMFMVKGYDFVNPETREDPENAERLKMLSMFLSGFRPQSTIRLVELKRIGYRWFHKPDYQSTEYLERLLNVSPLDITTPKEVYEISVTHLHDFSDYKDEKIENFDDRYIDFRLVKFTCNIHTLVVHGGLVGNCLYFSSIPSLINKLLINNVEVLSLKSLHIDNIPYKKNLYPAGKFPIRIKHLAFRKCKIGNEFLDFWTKYDEDNTNIKNDTDYKLTKLEFSNCILSYENVDTIRKNLRTNYIVRELIYSYDRKNKLISTDIVLNGSYNPKINISELFIEIDIYRLFIEIDGYMKRNREGYEKCKKAILFLLLANRHDRNNLFNTLPVDVMRLICKKIWSARGSKIWTYNISLDFLEEDLAEFM